MEDIILSGNVRWSYDYEIKERSMLDDLSVHFSGAGPYYKHTGAIALTNEAIYIEGDINLVFPLNDLEQLFLGFDEVYPRSLLKNFGVMTQPLRLKVSGMNENLYLFVDYNMIGQSANHTWFTTLRELLSEV